jgi:hypothetical protein
MMRKKRGYQRETPVELVRDYRLFAIACEGSKREPEYFKAFRFLSPKIAVDIIEEIVSNEEAISINPNKSAPKWVLNRAVKYIEKEGLSDEDQLWFVMDVDRWDEQQLREIANYCEPHSNWHIILSNPCFEVWLYFHKKNNILKSKSISCSDFKTEISKFDKGGYHPFNFIPFLTSAINNAKNADSDKNHFFPAPKETKVYKLCEALINIVSINDIEEFTKKHCPI